MRSQNARRRIGWTVIDQALSSLTNFGLGVLVARSLSPDDFGGFALIFSGYLFLVGVSRAIVSEPLLVRHSAERGEDISEAIAQSTGTAISLSAFAVAITLLASVVFASARLPLLVLAASLPGLLLQDAWRYSFFAAGRPAAAAVNDGLWAVSQLTGVVVLITTDSASVALLLAAWGASATICGGFGWYQSGVRPQPTAIREWLTMNRDLAPRFAGEFIAVGGAMQGVLWAVGLIGGVAAAGALRGGQLLVGPLAILFVAAPAAAIPEGARLYRRSPDRLIGVQARLSAGLGLIALIWGAVLLLMPDSIGEALLGESWSGARPLILPLAIGTMAIGVATGGIVGLRVLAAASRSLRVRLLVTPITFVLALIGVSIGGARGAAIGITTGGIIAAFVWWHNFRLALALESGDDPVASGGSIRPSVAARHTETEET